MSQHSLRNLPLLLVVLVVMMRPVYAHDGSAQLERERVSQFSFIWDSDVTPHPIAFVRLNGSRTAIPFLIDTGSPIGVLLTPETARVARMTIQPNPPHVRDGAGLNCQWSNSVPIEIVDRSNNTVGLQRVAACAAIASFDPIRESFGQRLIGGILGAPFFRDAATRFDFVHHVITLYPHGTHAPIAPNHTTLPLVGMTDSDALPHIALMATAKSPACRVSLDTGESIGTLNPNAIAAFPNLRRSPFTTKTVTFYGRLDGSRVRVPRLTLGDFTEANVDFDLLPDGIPFPPSLGTAFLSRFIVTIDAPRKQITFERATDYAARANYEPGLSELGIHRIDGICWVDSVLPGSPAETAGVHAGDRLCQVDSTNLESESTMTPETIASLIRGRAGAIVVLEIDRGGEQQQIRYKRAGYFGRDATAPDRPAIGFTLGHSIGDNHPLIVAVAPDSPAARSGLQSGDVVLAVNGTSTANQTFPEVGISIKNGLHSGTLCLTLLSRGDSKPHEVRVLPCAQGLPTSRETH